MKLTNEQRVTIWAHAYIAAATNLSGEHAIYFANKAVAAADGYAATLSDDVGTDGLQEIADLVGCTAADVEATARKYGFMPSEPGGNKNEMALPDRAEWLADKIAAQGEWAYEAAILLRKMAAELRKTATLPDQLETESLQLKPGRITQETGSAAVENCSQQFEVGGTCDQGLIVHVGKNTDRMIKVWCDTRHQGDVTLFWGSEITNYKPPVRLKCWRYGAKATFSPAEAHFLRGDGINVIPGYWTPDMRL